MKVLLVDDDPLFLELSKTFLEVFHAEPNTVESAREGSSRSWMKAPYDVELRTMICLIWMVSHS